MRARLLLALTGLLAGLLAWLFAFEREASVAARVRAPANEVPPESVDARPAETRLLEPLLPRTDDAPRLFTPDPEPPSESRRALEASPKSVVVRVQLALDSGERGAFQGWRVEAQSWLEETNETFPHETQANAAGLAEFRFPGFVHIDWVRCVPPPESGLAFAFAEDHVDLEPGEHLEKTLTLGPGALLGGRVVDERGTPVAGARVHAYADGRSWSDLSRWEPGLAFAVSAADGRFEFPRLPPSDWELAVEPDKWLQIEPPLGVTVEGRNAFEGLEAGSELAGGDLCVVPLHHFRVRVLDPANRPVAGAVVELRPLELRAGGLRLEEELETPSELDVFLGRAPPRDEGPAPRLWSSDLEWRTDAAGEAAVLGVTGTWELLARPRMTNGERSASATRQEIDLPSLDRTLILPARLVPFLGQVVDEDGRPIEGVEVRLVRTELGQASSAMISEADGRFAFTGLPIDGEYRLELSEAQYLRAGWPVHPGSVSADEPFVLRRAGWLRLRLEDQQGAPVKVGGLVALSLLPDTPCRPQEQPWLAQQRYGLTAGQLQLAQLPLGTIELGLELSFATGAADAVGNPIVEQRLFQRWVVPVQPGQKEQLLVVDLSSYAPPSPPPLATHVGVVLDARSGTPLAGATILVHSVSGMHVTRTDADGRFHTRGFTGPYGLTVRRDGYLPASFATQEWVVGEHEHRFLLEPGGHELLVHFADRDGVPLPTVQVLVEGEPGAPFVVQQNGNLRILRNGDFVSTDGTLRLPSVAPGNLRMQLSLAGHLLGDCAVEVRGGREPQEVTARLERSLAELRAEIESSLASEAEADEDG